MNPPALSVDMAHYHDNNPQEAQLTDIPTPEAKTHPPMSLRPHFIDTIYFHLSCSSTT